MSRRNASSRYLARRDRGSLRELTTPEGIPLRFTVAAAGDRANAFLLDFLIIMASTVVLMLLAVGAGGFSEGWTLAFAFVISFLLRNFYFMLFELRWQGATPGKRMAGIRVIDASGGMLSSNAIIARNLTRDVEVFLPLSALAAPEQLWPGAPGWAMLLAGTWLFVFALMPLFNKDRLRIGDMVAGTLVVVAPKSVLLEDLSQRAATTARRDGTVYEFSTEQLDVYGIYELQVLEDVLRQDEVAPNDPSLFAVCDKIKTKIKWDRSRWDIEPRRFLRDFYAALRARLEHRMLFGKKKQDKYQRTSLPPPD